MPDIAMCANGCPSKDTCWRFWAPPTPNWQSYMDFKPEPGQDKCDSYWHREQQQEDTL